MSIKELERMIAKAEALLNLRKKESRFEKGLLKNIRYPQLGAEYRTEYHSAMFV